MSQKPPPKKFVKNPIIGTKHTLLISSGIKMFDKLGVKILGLVDNMSFL